MDQAQEFVKSKTHGEILLKSAKTLRDGGQFTDFTVIANKTGMALKKSELVAHKLILAASSDFFRAMFRYNSIETQTNECHLKDITPTALEAVVEFCYTSQVGLSTENIEEILMAASILQIDTLLSVCVDYIIERMDVSNCLSFLILADRCNLPTLIESALNFCANRFDTILNEDEFLQLDSSLVSKILSHDQLFVANEEEVFSAMMKWIAANNEARIHELDILAAHVRFPLMSARSLRAFVLLRGDQIRSEKCQDLIQEAKKYHSTRSQMVGKRFEPRRPLRREQRIFAIGGWVDEDTTTTLAEKYDPYLDEWIEIKEMRKQRCLVNLSIVDDFLYVCGEFDTDDMDTRSLSCVERYNIRKDSWRCNVGNARWMRGSRGVWIRDGCIYANGHLTGFLLDYVNRFNPRTEEWEECPRPRTHRDGAGFTICNDSLYIMGGTDAQPAGRILFTEFIYTVERFDPSTNEWYFVAPMTGRSNFGCITFEGKIYVVGGEDSDENLLDTAECFDPVEARWESIPPMSVKRNYLGLIEMDGLIYAVGGSNNDGVLKTVEAYDPVKKEWTTKCPMINGRSAVGLASYCPLNQQPQTRFDKLAGSYKV